MNKLLLITFLFLQVNLFAALNASTIWEMRTTGSAYNGGGYFTTAGSTDYSQQDAAQVSKTNLYYTSGTTLKCDDASTFDDTMEGNVIYIDSGTHFTQGYYQVATYVDGNTITLDRAPASEDTSAHKDAVGALGGAIISPRNINFAQGIVAGNIVYIKAGTYTTYTYGGTQGNYFDTYTAGGNGNPIQWIGYNTTRGDNPTGDNRPIFDGKGTRTNGAVVDVSGNIFKNIIFKDYTGAGVTISAGGNVFENVRSTLNDTDGFYASGISLTIFNNCEADSNTSEGFVWNAANSNSGMYHYCYSHNNSAEGFEMQYANAASGFHLFNCTSESNSASGFRTAGNMTAINCVSYNNSGTNDGFLIAGDGITISQITNCVSKDNGRYAFNRSGTGRISLLFNYNCYNGHTTELNNITAGANDVGDQDPLFTDAANADFTLQAGSPCLGAGLDTIGGMTGDYKINIGVDQDDNSTASANDIFGIIN